MSRVGTSMNLQQSNQQCFKCKHWKAARKLNSGMLSYGYCQSGYCKKKYTGRTLKYGRK